jgi:hypothetical protein
MNSTQRLWNGSSRGLAATIALSMWTTLCADAHAAATRIRLSDGTPAQLRSAPTADPVALDIDVATLDAATTEAYLHAIDDRRRSKGLVFAIAGEARDGAAIVALACDGLLLLPGGALVGADGAWCDSASMREDLSEDLRQLGRLDGPLASRFVEAGAVLGWSASGGFNTRPQPDLTVALAGQPARLDSALLRRAAIVFGSAPSPDAAVREIEEGRGRVRASSVGYLGSRPAPATPNAPGTPGAPSAPSAPAAPPPPPTAPSNTPRVPAAPAPSGAHNAKVAPLVKDYRETLAEFLRSLKEFQGYYTGDSGRWTTQRGLREVWTAKTGQTRDGVTRTRCERLQRDLKSQIDTMGRLLKNIVKLADDPSHKDIVRMQEHAPTLTQLHDAIDDNDPSLCDAVLPRALRLEMP